MSEAGRALGASAASVETAERDARLAAERAGVDVRVLHTAGELEGARQIWDSAWPSNSESTQVTPNFLRAIEHAGGYVAGAYGGDWMMGAILAIVGRRREGSDWVTYLHSHMAATATDATDRGIGRALKMHQRSWSLAHGLGEVAWTFDPLVRRNARLNLNRLGAFAAHYHVDFYGEMPDETNAGDPTDRVVATWALDSSRVAAAVGSPPPESSSTELVRAGAVVVLREDDEGGPEIATDWRSVADAVPRLLAIPTDVAAMRKVDRDLSLRWRLAVRNTLGASIVAGFAATALTSDGYYVVTHRTSSEGIMS